MPNYGDASQLMDMQASAPLAQSSNAPSSPALQAGGPAQQQGPQAVPLSAPSQNPNEPVTNGAARGPGAGPEAINTPPTAQQQGFINALSLLNQLGDNVTPEVKSIRNVLAAHLNNQPRTGA